MARMRVDQARALLSMDPRESLTADELRKAYKKAALRWHPDKNPENREHAALQFRRVRAAYECLTGDGRAEYEASPAPRPANSRMAPSPTRQRACSPPPARPANERKTPHEDLPSFEEAWAAFKQMFSDYAELLRLHPIYRSGAAVAAVVAPHIAAAASAAAKASVAAAPHFASAARASASAAVVAAPHVARASLAAAVLAGDVVHHSLLSSATAIMPDMEAALKCEADQQARIAANCLVSTRHAQQSLEREQATWSMQLRKAESRTADYVFAVDFVALSLLAALGLAVAWRKGIGFGDGDSHSYPPIFLAFLLLFAVRSMLHSSIHGRLVEPVNEHYSKRVGEWQAEIESLCRQHKEARRNSERREVNLVNASRLGLQRLSGRLFGC